MYVPIAAILQMHTPTCIIARGVLVGALVLGVNFKIISRYKSISYITSFENAFQKVSEWNSLVSLF